MRLKERTQAEWEAIGTYLEPILSKRELDAPILRQIPGDLLRDLWPLFAERMAQLVERSRGRWTIQGIAERIYRDQWQLWVVWDGRIRALVGTQINVEMSGMKIGNIVFTTGNDPSKWVHLVDELETWARAQGCATLEAVARPAWGKYLTSYRKTHLILEKELGHAGQQADHQHLANLDAVDVGAAAGAC